MSTCRRIKEESRYRAPLKRYRERDALKNVKKNDFMLPRAKEPVISK